MTEKVTFTAYLKDAMSSGFSKIMKSGNSAFGKLENENRKLERTMLRTGRNIDGLREKLDQLERTRNLSLDIRQIRSANREIDRTQRELDRLENLGRRKGGGLGSMVMGGLGGMFAGAAILGGAVDISKQAITVASERQRLKSLLGNTLGSNTMADIEFDRIKQFAKDTPYQVTELTDGFVKLTNRGLKPSMDDMKKLGDFTAVTTNDFSQLVEAVLDANNSERWREIGVEVKTMGDKMQLTYRGTTVEVENTTAGAMKAVKAFGEMNGVVGASIKQMETLGGKSSNLKDSWDNLMETVGNSEGWKSAMSGLTSLLDGLNSYIGAMDKITSSDYLSFWEKVSSWFNTGQAAVNASMVETIIKSSRDKAMEFSEKLKKDYLGKDIKVVMEQLTTMKSEKETELESLRRGRKLSNLGKDTAKYELVRQQIIQLEELIANPDFFKIKKAGSGTGTGTGVTGGIDAGLSSVTGDNRAVRNIHINIGKQIESLYIQSQTMEQGADQFVEHLKRVLLTAVNDANRIAG